MKRREMVAIAAFFLAGILFDIATGFRMGYFEYVVLGIISPFMGIGAARCFDNDPPEWMKGRRYN